MSGIEVVLAALGVIVLLGIGAFVTVILVLRTLFRRMRRSPAVGGAVLRGRARLSRGPQRAVLALRVRLAESLESGRAAVDLASGSGRRSELPRLFGRIREEGDALDLQLRLLESETDDGVRRAELPGATGRVEQVEHLVRRLRSAVAAGLAGTTDDSLPALGAELDREVAALHAGIEELRALNRRDHLADPALRPTTASTTPTARHEGNPS